MEMSSMILEKTSPTTEPTTEPRGGQSTGPGQRPLSRVLMWHWDQAGAGAKFTFELAQELRALPEVKLVLSSAVGSDLEALVPKTSLADYAVRTFEGNKSSLRGKLAAAAGLVRLPLIARRFRRVLTKGKVDLTLCTFQSIWDAAALPVLWRGSIRSVLILHDAFFHPGDGYPLRHWVLRRQIGNADALIVLSDHVRQQAMAAFAFPDEWIWTMRHGAFAFGVDEICPAVHPRGSRPLRLILFGRIVAYKGLDHLLRALRELRPRSVPVELVIAGAGDLEP